MPRLAFRLLLCRFGLNMNRLPALLLLLCLAAMVAGAHIGTRHHAARSHTYAIAGKRVYNTAVIDAPTQSLPSHHGERAAPHVDINGNDVDDAVADYRIDDIGEMYESHSPDTALLHVGAPKM